MSKIVFFFLLIISCGYLSLEISWRFRAVKLGRPENRSGHARERWKYFTTYVLLHKKIRKLPFFGLMHGFMMWGFLVLLFSNLEMVLIGLFKTQIPWLGDNPGYLFLRDLFLVLVIIGVLGTLLRRLLKKPEWLHNSLMSFIILALILVIIGSEIVYYVVQTSLGEGSSLLGRTWSVFAISKLFVNLNKNSIQDIIHFFWWTHFLAIFAFFFLIPRSKHLHLIFAPLNTYWHSLEPKGALIPVQLGIDNREIYGVGKPEDFTWKQLFDAFSCVKCGRCHGSCPVFQSGEQLKLKKLNGRLRTHVENKTRLPFGIRNGKTASAEKSGRALETKLKRKKLVAGVFEEESIWNCTTCGACEEACPVSCEHIAKIIDMRRYLVSSEKNIASEIKEVFSGIENWGNPWGSLRHWNMRYAWAQELGIQTFVEKPDAEYLYFVGCTPSFDSISQKTAVSFANILKSIDLDFSILGKEEFCCGETTRRLGNEFLFRETAKRNISRWNSYGIKKIITTCPHCFNTLHNEYPQFGGNYEVIFHAAFLADLLRTGKLKPEKYQKRNVTYHDPCYLGRYNGIYNEPRKILQSIPGVNLVEMPRTKEDSFCCGAGGGLFWLKTKSKQAITKHRVKEALDTESEIISTACPYCKIVLQEETGCKGLEKGISIMDIVEILESSL